eukprot:1418025-Amphidinium_carterae.1
MAIHTFGAQHANAVLEARVISLEEANPKFMSEMIKRFTHMYEKLNENDTNLGGELNILKEDVKIFLGQIEAVKQIADNVKEKALGRMASYETQQRLHQEQIKDLRNQVTQLQEIIRQEYQEARAFASLAALS